VLQTDVTERDQVKRLRRDGAAGGLKWTLRQIANVYRSPAVQASLSHQHRKEVIP
jgi:hypothetical protein